MAQTALSAKISSLFRYDPDSGRVSLRTVLGTCELDPEMPAIGPILPTEDVSMERFGEAVVRAPRGRLYLKYRVIYALMGHSYQRGPKFRDSDPNNWTWENIAPRSRINATGHPYIYSRPNGFQAHIYLDDAQAYIGRYDSLSLALRMQAHCMQRWPALKAKLEKEGLTMYPGEMVAILKGDEPL